MKLGERLWTCPCNETVSPPLCLCVTVSARDPRAHWGVARSQLWSQTSGPEATGATSGHARALGRDGHDRPVIYCLPPQGLPGGT